MLPTRQEIQLNYHKTIVQANDLEELADCMDAMRTGTLDESLGSIAATWKGDTANKYHTKGARLSEKIKAHSNELRQTARVLRNAAENTYRAELRVLELAEKRWGF